MKRAFQSIALGSRPLRGIDRPTIEVHLKSGSSPVDQKTLSPSLLTTALEIGRIAAKPIFLALCLITTVLLASGKISFVKSTYQTVLFKLAENTNVEFFDGLALSARLDLLEGMLLENAAPDPARLADQKSQIKFISGLIAVHRPNILDCGAVAKDIVELSAAERIDPFFVAAVISVESRFGAEAMSPAGARGLMQLMPSTAGEITRMKTDKRLVRALSDARINILLGIAYLKQLEAKYRGKRGLILAAYNWGPNNVDSALKDRIPFPRSVRQYVLTIDERARQWAKHYEKAKQGASSLEAGI